MHCLVTGASGFIGSALIKQLIQEGHYVRAVIHITSLPHKDNRIEYITADLTNSSLLPSIVHDIDIIFHCAAMVKDFGSKKEILNVNLKGTQNLVDACRNKIQKFIFISHLHNKSILNLGAYNLSKFLAEQYLLEKHYKEQLPVVIIRPGNVYGPGATTWVLRPLRAIQNDRIALINNGTGLFLHTYIDNLVDALVSTINQSHIDGEIIEITDGDNKTTWGTYFNDLAAISGKPPITKTMTKTTALFISYLMMIRYYLFHIDPLLTPTAVRILTNNRNISIEKGIKLLNYQPSVNYIEGMKRTANWLKMEHYI